MGPPQARRRTLSSGEGAKPRERSVSPRSNGAAKFVFRVKALLRRLRWAPHDLARRFVGKGEPVEPPRGISFVGKGDFSEVGEWYVERFEEVGGMESGDRVLDIGCGIGRMAIPLMDVLKEGSYEGFDTSKTMIRWCDRHLSTRQPNFRFTYAPIFNRKYNPFGTIDARDFVFPYPDNEFDFAFATSVFTHLGIEDSARYLEEISRVLKPGGTALVTCFLLGGSGRPSETKGLPFDFRYDFGPLRSTDADEPEAAVAFPEDVLFELIETTGMEVDRPVSYGRWPEIDRGPDVQDSVVMRRPELL